jgi:hypothetical protein
MGLLTGDLPVSCIVALFRASWQANRRVRANLAESLPLNFATYRLRIEARNALGDC